MTASPPALKLQHHFACSVGELFKHWADPMLFAKWSWGSIAKNPAATVDFRVGGAFRVETDAKDGQRWAFSGVYTQIEPNARIVHTLKWHAPMGYPDSPEVVEIHFTPDANGTQLEFIHAGVADEKARATHREGWIDTFQTLQNQL